MKQSGILKLVLLVVAAAFLLSGCTELVYAPKHSVWYYHKELPEADQAIAKAQAAGKDKECPDLFAKAAKMRDDAYDTYLACHTAEGIELAKKAIQMANALCPPKPQPAPEPAKAREWKEVAKIVLVNFATDKSNIEAKYYVELNQAIDFAKHYPDAKIEVDGHTDNKASKSYNDALSMRRATAVADYLEKQGISSSRIKANGFGFSQPVDTNATAAGRAKNRRVEIRISSQIEKDSYTPAKVMKPEHKKVKKAKKAKKAVEKTTKPN
ncbi:OmpA family protein [Candidatus Magnetomonas plexicatena]|uniref:OmpA family protein n=1 Tax=Candidatus Magnetomonas plexicatena TaxID=2552947 RepID=UPI001100D7F1|nr:OmpA family protein [Nitrospirales bacterium LBB_01]